MSYVHDVFLSYNKDAGVMEWVERHFYPVLLQELQANTPFRPRDADRVFNYRLQASGNDWRDRVKAAHLGSRVLVAIWTPPYFASEICRKEWRGMCARADQCQELPGKFVFPILYSGRTHYPADAVVQLYDDFSQFAFPDPVFRENAAFLQFRLRVRALCQAIDASLGAVPSWRDDFPVVEAQAGALAPFGLPGP